MTKCFVPNLSLTSYFNEILKVISLAKFLLNFIIISFNSRLNLILYSSTSGKNDISFQFEAHMFKILQEADLSITIVIDLIKLSLTDSKKFISSISVWFYLRVSFTFRKYFNLDRELHKKQKKGSF